MALDLALPPRSALYLPASNARAVEKARTLDADLIILDLEDAVKPGLKDEARSAATAAAEHGFDGRLCAIRINGPESNWHAADIAAVRESACDLVVLPKVESVELAEDVAEKCRRPLLAMVETPTGVLNAASIARGFDVAGLIAGVNDLANALRVPLGAGRAGLSVSLQTIVLAARAADIWVFDGVFNDLNADEALEAECIEGKRFGFDGKTLIHPNQIAITNRVWQPSAQELEDAHALVAASSGGAERFRDRMIETMHVEMAKRMIERSMR